MQIRAVNRNNGRAIIAKLREKGVVKLRRKPGTPFKNSDKVA